MGNDSETAITTRRNEVGMTQAEAATKASISLATWRRFEQSPSLSYRGDTIRGVLRALKLSRDELTRLLDGTAPEVSDGVDEKAQAERWNQLWRATDCPSITPRMAAAIQVALDSAQDFLEDDLKDGSFDPEDAQLFDEFDPRVFIELGDNRPWFRAMGRRMRHLASAMEKGQLIDQSCECFADAALFGAAVRSAAATWDDLEGAWQDYSDDLPSQDHDDDDEDDQASDYDDRWADFTDDLDDLMPYREWDCVFPEYRMARHLLNHRPVNTWFDEPDHELEAVRNQAHFNVLAQELMSPQPSRAQVWMNELIQTDAEDVHAQAGDED